MSKKMELLKEYYEVNEKEYFKLLKDGHHMVMDFEEWTIINKRMYINKALNSLFERDPFIQRLIFDDSYSNLIADKNDEGLIGELDRFSFDHTFSIRLSSNVNVFAADTIRGIITFPYFHNWGHVKNWIDKVPLKSFSVYIINPLLIFYGLGTVGLFLTPKYYNGYYIELCNRYIICLTGYPLFLTFSCSENVEEINYWDLELSKNNFIEEVYERSGKDKAVLKMLNFWKKNPEVSIHSIEDNFKDYMDAQPYPAYATIKFNTIKSSKAFRLVHEDTQESLGNFKEFFLNEILKAIHSDDEYFQLTDRQLEDILKGKYDFEIID